MPFSSGLMPGVSRTELFVASAGSSILRVLGTRMLFSLFSSCRSASLECFPSIGELSCEHVILFGGPLLSGHGELHIPLGQPGIQLQSCGIIGKGTTGVQIPGAAIINGDTHDGPCFTFCNP